MGASSKDFSKIYQMFSAPIAQKLDCGRYCAPLNGGQPVCCTTHNAVPVADNTEWRLLKQRTDLWHKFKPFDAETRAIVNDLPKSCTAIECKGAAFCERDNRTLACRAFPFYPYFTRERTLFGLAYYWTFEDRCWVISNLGAVEPDFVREHIAAYEYLFAKDEDEEQAYVDNSADMRRVFSRWERDIPLIGREGGFFKVEPKSGGRIIKAQFDEFKPLGPYRSQKAYEKAIKQENGDPQKAPQLPSYK